jgi:hypothetical protein
MQLAQIQAELDKLQPVVAERIRVNGGSVLRSSSLGQRRQSSPPSRLGLATIDP